MADSRPQDTRPLSNPFATPLEPLFPTDVTSVNDSLSIRTTGSSRHRRRSKSRSRSNVSRRTVEYYSLDSQSSVYSASVYSSSVCSASSTVIARPGSPVENRGDSTSRSPYGSSSLSALASKSTPQLTLPRKATVCVTPSYVAIDASRMRKVTIETAGGDLIRIENNDRKSRKRGTSSSPHESKHRLPTSHQGSSTTGTASDYARQALEHTRQKRDRSEHRHRRKKDGSSLQIYVASGSQVQSAGTRTDNHPSPLRRAISFEDPGVSAPQVTRDNRLTSGEAASSPSLVRNNALVRPSRKSVNPPPEVRPSVERNTLPREPEFVDSRGKPLQSRWSDYSKEDDPKSGPAEASTAKGGKLMDRLKGFTKKKLL